MSQRTPSNTTQTPDYLLDLGVYARKCDPGPLVIGHGAKVVDNRKIHYSRTPGEVWPRYNPSPPPPATPQAPDEDTASSSGVRWWVLTVGRALGRLLFGIIGFVVTLAVVSLLPAYAVNSAIGSFSSLLEAFLTSLSGSQPIVDPFVKLAIWILLWSGLTCVALSVTMKAFVWLTGGQSSASDSSTAATDGDKKRLGASAKLAEAKALHDELDARWHGYETSLDAILARPLMRDLTDPAVIAVVRARGEAQLLRGELPTKPSSTPLEYLRAVSHYQSSLDAAERKAETHDVDDFPAEERGDIKLARTLLAKALDSSATRSERQVAYDRVLRIIKDLRRLSVPEESLRKAAIAADVTPHAELPETATD